MIKSKLIGFAAWLLEKTFPHTELALRLELKVEGADWAVRPPDFPINNTTLRSRSEVEDATNILIQNGFYVIDDIPKNWDALIALSSVLENTSAGDFILDAGAPLYSSILPWLFLSGYTNLIGIDLIFDKEVNRGPIRYLRRDLTSTEFPDCFFSAVTCMSVIERGVDLKKYFLEMFRILKPGGVLVTSTDYWETGVDTQGKIAFGEPVVVFDRRGIEIMLEIATECGFESTGEINFDCGEKVVHWDLVELDYTFIVFTLRRPS
ncbi:methyltransferase domain-containing protein [Rhodophyticola sp. CCM32]|uniref:methyltransferase domain-containing protein n=1 Tax=Rhodophyticola sp. CCM32 TaxID=2916397 RepID=UPI00143DA77F|nr:methyltransferase domain-containing protein [Rhodophyticola sp. CCM32]